MKVIISRACLLILLSSLSAAAQHAEGSAERAPKRKALGERLAQRAVEDKKNATAWAQARGLPMRVDNGIQLRELMAIHNGKPLYYKTLNEDAAISTAADRVRNTSPYNLNGAGIKVGVWDGGSVLTSHQEFIGRVVDNDNVASHYHATHVGGTIGASGVKPSAKGMAPSVSIESYDWYDDRTEMENVAASAAGQTNKIYLSNHSYGIAVGWEGDDFEGYDRFGQYIVFASLVDEIVYENPYYLPFVSAGNDRSDGPGDAEHPADGVYKDGYDTVSYYGVAKNVMTVGAVHDAVSGASRSLAQATMPSFSSWGPTDDGRIKPDIVANGVWLYSCDDDHDSDYASFSGTSMASPNACGSAALLVEYYKELFSGGAMRASTLKGLILHTADDLGRPGPDYINGWGLMNTLAAAELLRDRVDNSIRLTEDTVKASQKSDTYTFFSDGNEPVRVTLCWTDPEGASTTADDSRISRLINDLDLKVVSPSGTSWPYKLDYANPSNNATATGENNIDNVEQVYIAAPVAGQYTVTVDYDGSLTGVEQGYSLLISGPGSDSDADGMSNAWESEYFGGSTNAVASDDADGDGADNLTEYISGYDPTNSASVFEVTRFTAPPSGNAPFIIVWNPVAGRIYDVRWSPNLVFTPFTTLGANLPYTQNSYTDSVERTGLENFYRVDVRLDQ